MAKKINQETQEEQSERFRAAVRQMIVDGELSPTEADKAFEALMSRVGKHPTPANDENGC